MSPHDLTWPHKTAGRRRFAREREILSALEHPNIARLYDAGVDAAGRPYMAIEYVEGLTPNAYCDSAGLGVTESLRLLLQVADAVAYAHSRLVLHRDLKPANILVNGQGQVRLIDFGIAKLMEGGQAAETAPTRAAGRALTLDYASPEQIRGEAIGTASDVYSLGVVAFELLAGVKPYKLKRGSAAELEEAITAQDLPLRSAAAQAPATARQLRGDIDAIVNRALKKNPAERYPTVDAMAHDLRRHLEGGRVQARPDTLAYRARRLLRRYRLPLGAGLVVVTAFALALGTGATALVIGVLLLGLGAALWQARKAREQARRAQQESRRAQAVQDFVFGLFRANADSRPDPQRALATTAREPLDIGAARVLKELDQTPEVKDAMLSTLSELYIDVGGLNDEAAALSAERVALRRALYGANDLGVAVALVDQANAIDSSNDSQRSLPLLRTARQIVDRAPTSGTDVRLRVLFAQAQATSYTEVSASLGFIQGATALMQRRGTGGDSLRRALYVEGLNLGFLGEHSAGLQRLEQAQRLSLGSTGPQAQWQIPECTAIYSNASAIGDFGRAESALLHALQMSRRVNGPDHVDTKHVLLRLMRLYAWTSRAAESQAIEVQLRTLLDVPAPQRDANLDSILLRTMSVHALENGRFGDAALLAVPMVESYRRFTGDSLVLAMAMQTRARTSAATAALDEAERELAQASEMLDRALGSRQAPSGLATIRMDQAVVRLWAGDAAGALALLDRLAESLPVAMADARLKVPAIACWRAAALLDTGRAAEAVEAAVLGLRSMSFFLRPADLPLLRADLLLEQGLALHAADQSDPARDVLAAALTLRQQNDDDRSIWRAMVELALARTVLAQGDREQARTLAASGRARASDVPMLAPHLARRLQRVEGESADLR
ncbi:MAG: serine/threonine-protein kinase [Rubrivivax sp.]